MATLTVLNFKQQFVQQKWPRTGKGAITKGLEISSWDLKKARNIGDDQIWSVAADIFLSGDVIRWMKCDQILES